ncbi:hypothetical protein DES53_10871 [Roseimicrobium gellanilyticum]|uniref:Uncharacterized protein n=1 Tax=Roseimicrobium gellanilyticum TaxID=748857 RepID=A0A366HF78_9BACT|nr:hypothetical protein [Roseimicrobium gellanilyticum]RBP40364.1 hypothetical protein DES53_10871 [Roseimicrobium gellanilyticum]
MPLDFDFGDLGDIFTSGDVWTWFQLTGSFLVWLVTFGQVWLMDSHEHWSGFIGLMFHVALIAGLTYSFGGSDVQHERPPAAKVEAVPVPKAS